MKKDGWKALILAANIFLMSACYGIKKSNNKNTEVKKEPIEVISVAQGNNNETNEIIYVEPTLNPSPVIVPDNSLPYTQTNNCLDEIAEDVIKGNWGNGELRKQLLTEAGYNYNDVMRRVNEILGYTKDENDYYNETELIPKEEYNISGSAAYLNKDTILYDENNNSICSLNKYDKVILGASYNGNKRLVTIPYLYQGYIDESALTSLPNTYIEVDISLQIVKIYVDDEIVFEADVITGNPNKGTIPGTNLGCTEVSRIEYDTYLIGKNYKKHVNIFVVFNDNEEGFHGADEWRSHDEYNDKTRYLTNGSNGCVNMKDNDAMTLGEYAEVGTKVLIHK